MLKIFIGSLIIYLSPIYIVETPVISSYIFNFIGTTLLFEGCSILFEENKKKIKIFKGIYLVTLLVLIYQFIINIFNIKITENTNIVMQGLLIFLPLLLVHITLTFIKDIDSYLLITNKLILGNLTIILILFIMIILYLFNIKLGHISNIIISVLKLIILLGFYKLVIYYSP